MVFIHLKHFNMYSLKKRCHGIIALLQYLLN